MIGDIVLDPDYGEGIIVNKIGSQLIVDFNHILAGKDIEFEYEILERITDPTEQFFRMLSHLGPKKHDSSFENGKGIINLELPLMVIDGWSVLKTKLTWELFKNLPSLKTLEFREKYMDE